MAVLASLLLEDSLPRALGVVEDEGDKVDFRFFRLVVDGTRLLCAGADGSAASKKSKEVAVEKEAQHEDDEKASNAEMREAEAAKAGRVSATIFKV
jgi:hypothetical protein